MNVFITGIGGLIGSTVADVCRDRSHQVWGIDNDQRGKWFGKEGSVYWRIKELQKRGISVTLENFRARTELVKGADLIVHCASQPSHDFSRSHVLEDSLTNYMGTVELLEATRRYAPNSVFAFLSTNKVYGDSVNSLHYETVGKRFKPSLIGYDTGIHEEYDIDGSLHTPFGVSKAAADLMVQEYRYCFAMKTVCFRCGCLTGKSGSAIELQGFLGYLVKCAVEKKPYTIYGHEGYQVRDNIDAADVASAILAYANNPKSGVYNMGGGPANSVSILECVDYLKERHGLAFQIRQGPERLGDHKWYVSDTGKFEKDYPEWTRKSVWEVIDDLVSTEQARKAAKNHGPMA